MANPKHFAILMQGVEVWNQWREEHPHIKPNLCQASLAEMDLRHANSRASLLSKADFTGANLAETNFVGTDLHETCFDEAILSRTDVSRTDLHEAKLPENLTNIALLGQNDICIYGQVRKSCMHSVIQYNFNRSMSAMRLPVLEHTGRENETDV